MFHFLMPNPRTEKIVRQSFGQRIQSAVAGWEEELVRQLDKAQLLQALDLLRHEHRLLQLASRALLAHPLSEDELAGLAHLGDQEMRREVLRRLLALQPTASQLADGIVFCQDPRLRRAAATELLRRQPTNRDLYRIILHVNDSPLVAAAIERWDPDGPTHDVVHVLRYLERPRLAQIFWTIFLQDRRRTTTDVSYVMNFTRVASIRNQAAALLLTEADLGLDDLSYVASRSSERAVVRRACDRLLQRGATSAFQLISVIQKHPSQAVRAKVARQLLDLPSGSRHFKQLGADTVYAHILCSCRDASVCARAWEKFLASVPTHDSFLKLISQKGQQAEHRQAANAWLERRNV